MILYIFIMPATKPECYNIGPTEDHGFHSDQYYFYLIPCVEPHSFICERSDVGEPP